MRDVYAGKLILSGLIGLFKRGSIAQTVLATLVSFAFFGLAFRVQPFKVRCENQTIFSENDQYESEK